MYNYSGTFSSCNYYSAQYYINVHNERLISEFSWSNSAPVRFEVDKSWAAKVEADLKTVRSAIAQIQQCQKHQQQRIVDHGERIRHRVNTTAVQHTDAVSTGPVESVKVDVAQTIVPGISSTLPLDVSEDSSNEDVPRLVQDAIDQSGIREALPTHCELQDDPPYDVQRDVFVEEERTNDVLMDSSLRVSLSHRQPKPLINTTQIPRDTSTTKEEQYLTRWLGLGSLRLLCNVQKLQFANSGLLWIFAGGQLFASSSNTLCDLVGSCGGRCNGSVV